MADSIAGVYVLYYFQNPGLGPVTSMVITDQGDGCFSVRGLDQAWAGEGFVEGPRGRYCWRLADGRTGQTLFTVNPDGSLTGHVLGDGEDWWYLARRSPHGGEDPGVDRAEHSPHPGEQRRGALELPVEQPAPPPRRRPRESDRQE
jgi:hypothetical protein